MKTKTKTMENCWRITQHDKHLFNQIYKMFLYNENYGHVKFAFQTWLDDDINQIYIVKRNNKWTYVLTGTNVQDPDDARIILNIRDLILN